MGINFLYFMALLFEETILAEKIMAEPMAEHIMEDFMG